MGKGSELLQMLKTGNTEQARRLAAKLKKQGKKKYSAALNDQDEDGYTPLHYAAAYNFLDFLEEFIESGATIDVGDQKGATPLHLAALNGRLEATRILLHRGADPNIAARSGDTPLHLGSLNGHADVVEALVREHSKCAMLNVSGQTSLDLACQNGHASVVGILLRSGQFSQSYLQHSDIPQTAMKLAAKHGHTEVLNLLVKHGFDVNKLLPSAHGTCLHEAALYGKIDSVQYLLQAGADPSITNSQGLTPLDIVNQYTDPRSASQLKLILQDGLANQARARIANHHQQQQQVHRPMSYAPQSQQQQQPQYPYERSHSLSRAQPQTAPQTQPQATQPAHIQQQQAYHQAYQQAFYAQHRQQHHSTPTTGAAQSPVHQPAAQAYTQAYAQHQQQQAYTQQQQQQQQSYAQQQAAYTQQQQAYAQQQAAYTQQQQGYAQPAATTAQHPPPSPSIAAKGGGGLDFASMIATKAALRKQTSTESPGFGEEGGIVRSSTLSGGSRMQRPLSQKRERRSSLTDESAPSTNDYASNAPTLPRRSNQGPPSFCPPPPDTLSHSSSSSSVGTVPPPLRKVEKPRPSPPPATMENELMAKLRRRQQTIEDEKAAPPTEEPPKPEATRTTPPPAPPPREDSVQSQPEPPKVAAKPPPPKPKPKPVKEDSPKPSWQEEVARRKAERKQKEEQEEREEAERLEKERLERERIEKEKVERERAERERLEAEEQERQRLEREREEKERLERERIERERLENERIERERIEKERLEAERRERMERQQVEQQRVERERLEREEQERQRLEQEAALKRRSSASQGTPERQVPPPVKAKPHAHPPPPAPPVVVEDNRMPTMTSDEESLPSTTPASEMFESTSMNSLVGAAAGVGSTSNMHSQAAFECIPIADWLMSYKLSEYVTLFENNGYDNTDFLLGIPVEELTELGVTKPGHRRRMMAALNQLLPKEHLLTIKPASVAEWLMQLGLNQYEEVMMESGYDDIDFVSCITEEELMDIGITKKGHLKRFRKGVQELIDMQKSEPATPSPFTQPYNHLNIQSSPSQSMSNLSASSHDQTSHRDSIAVSEGDVLLEPPSAGGSPGKGDPSEHRTRAGSSERGPPPIATRPARSSRNEKHEETPTPTELSTTCSQDSGIESMGAPGHRQGNNFSKMKTMLEQRMGLREDGCSEEEEKELTPPPHPVEAPRPSSPKPHGKAAVPPPPIPRRSSNTSQPAGGREVSPLIQSHQQSRHEDTDYVNEIPPQVPQHRNSRTEYTVADVAAVDMVGSSPSSTEGTPVRSVPAAVAPGGELDELDRVLMGFDKGPAGRPPLPRKASVDGEGEEQTDQLLADIDNMLADLNTHLDIMIPGSDV